MIPKWIHRTSGFLNAAINKRAAILTIKAICKAIRIVRFFINTSIKCQWIKRFINKEMNDALKLVADQEKRLSSVFIYTIPQFTKNGKGKSATK
jgi:hypothetical protein